MISLVICVRVVLRLELLPCLAMLTAEVADAMALQFATQGTDPNEVAKTLTHLVAHQDGRKFFTYLRTVVGQGGVVIRSGRTLDYYRHILKVCEEHLTPYQDDPKIMAEILGWAVRLMRYYQAVPEALKSTQATTGARTQAIRQPQAPASPQTGARTALANLQIGELRTGTVKNVRADLGAFVDIGAEKDGLVHVSELGGERLDVGETARVRVTRVDRERGRIGLALAGEEEPIEEEAPRSAVAEAFERAQQRAAAPPAGQALAIGQELHGRVGRLVKPWILVELETGGTGELHSSEGGGLSEGQEVIVWVKSAEPGRKPRVTLKQSGTSGGAPTEAPSKQEDILKKTLEQLKKQRGG